MKKLLFILLLLPACGWGTIRTVTTLPYTSQADKDTIRLSGNLSSATNGIYLIHDSVLIDGQSDTITFGTGGGNSNYGLAIANQAYGCIIQDLAVMRSDVNTTATGNKALNPIICHDILIQNCYFYTSGDEAHVLETQSVAVPGVYNLHLKDCVVESNVHTYSSRCSYGGAAIYFAGSPFHDMGEGTYSAWLENVDVIKSPGVGIVCNGYNKPSDLGTFYIEDCSVHVDMRASEYGTDTCAGTCEGTANAYGIMLKKAGPGSYIKNCQITSGTTYFGGRGILMEDCQGEEGNYVYACSNYVDVHEGWECHYGFDKETHALRIRWEPGTTEYWDYVHIYDNTFISTAYSGTRDSHEDSTYCNGASATKISASNSQHFIYERNLARTVKLTEWGYSSTFGFDICEGGENYIIRHNRFESDGIFITWGDAGTGNDYGAVIYQDTFIELSPRWDSISYKVGTYPSVVTLKYPTSSFQLGYNDDNAYGDTIRDCYFGSASLDTNIWNAIGGTRYSITLQENLLLYVMGNNDSLVSNATVWWKNAYGDSVSLGSTGSNGYTSGYATYWYDSTGTGADLTAFNNFTVGAFRAADSTNQSLTLGQNFVSDTIVLTNTSGDIGGGGGVAAPPIKFMGIKAKGIKR